ncbi:serine/arginine repetitive matrix protein 2-like isoform X1 [Thrips palmi]|uniref:Serine/arginine repetitive matrix protein 2-like isoform X1 n=1 Tax=Thrips palmi TaxID=161013 RepID=A0A6P9AAS6_THRPL|nr:serine/arginine repetitive matrix protein 2-like isoform X1 [Thrips palmi]
MTQRRQTRASASSTTRVAVAKRKSAKENAVAPSARGGSTQTRKSLSSLSKTVKSTASSSLRKKTSSTLLSSKNKKNVAKKIGKPSVKVPVASKSSPAKLSAKSASSDPKQKPGKLLKNVSSGQNLRSSPKKISSAPLNVKPSTPKSAASNVHKSSPRFLKISNVVSLSNSASAKRTVKVSSSKLTASSMKKDTSKQAPSKQTPSKQTRSKPTPSKLAVKPKQAALKKSPQSSPRRTPLKQAALKQPPQSSPKRTPSKPPTLKQSPQPSLRRSLSKLSSLKQSLQSSPRRSLVKQTSLKQSPQSSPRQSSLKQTSLKQSPQSSPRRPPLKQTSLKQSPQSSPRRSPLNRTAMKQSPQSPSRQSSAKQTPTQGTPSKQTPKQQASTCSPNIQSRSSRKRLLPSPAQSPLSPKVRKVRGAVESLEETKLEKVEDECVVVDEVSTGRPSAPGKYGVGQQRNLKSVKDLPTTPELSNSFLRRKWFSLKAQGGFACLRSAVLSPEEVTKEVINHSSVDQQAPANPESDFFTAKLMARLSSRLPHFKARPSCEELVDLINAKRYGSKFEPRSDCKKEGTAIRVKSESRSFSDTLSHIKNKPVKSSYMASQVKNSLSKPELAKGKADSKPEPAKRKRNARLIPKHEREMALRQLKDLSAPEKSSPDPGKSAASSSTNSSLNDSNNRKRWFSLKSRGASSSLRSAILSPEELTAEFMKRTRVDPQTCLTAQSLLKQESRGSYKGVSTEELVNLIQTKQMEKHLESLKPKKEEGASSGAEKTREQQLALQQLNVLRYW